MQQQSRPLELFDLNEYITANQRIEYIPASEEMLEDYGKAVSQALKQKFNTTEAFQTEFTRGFTNFVKVITQIHARYLSTGVHYDQRKTPETG